MTPTVPLHCLVLDGVGSSARFPFHERLSVARAAEDLCGPLAAGWQDHTVGRAAAREVVRRAGAKLALGERVMVSAEGLDRPARQALAREAHHLGLPVIWLSAPDDRDLARGDGVAEVIRCPRGAEPPAPVPAIPDLRAIRDRHAGVTVIGDVHGAHHSMLAALAWARSRGHFVVLLGDVIDAGAGSLDAAEEAWRLVTRGEAAMVLGNHEHKIARWLDMREGGPPVKLSEGNRVTTQALSRLGPDAARRWAARFRGLLRRAVPVLDLGSVVLAHAAVHPQFWSLPPGSPLPDALVRHAIYGETDPAVRPPNFRLGYRWVDAVPGGSLVVVGHDTRSEVAPVVTTGASGGRVVFLDTGSGKGGVLSSADLRFGTDGRLRLANLNVH